MNHSGSDKTPIISVIMPVFNGEAFLEKAIFSVLSQGLDLELVVVEDCSTDGSRELLTVLAEQDSRIRLILMEQNSGVAACRNRGVSEAKGAYVAFLDCDDWWEPGKLQMQLALMQETGCAVSCTAREFAEADGRLTGRIVPVQERITYRDLLRVNSIALSSSMVRTEIARKFPMEHDDCHEDYMMWLNMLKTHGEARGINLPLLKYRRSPQAKTGNKLKSAQMHYKSLRKHGISPLPACLHFVQYAVNGLIHHGGIR